MTTETSEWKVVGLADRSDIPSKIYEIEIEENENPSDDTALGQDSGKRYLGSSKHWLASQSVPFTYSSFLDNLVLITSCMIFILFVWFFVFPTTRSFGNPHSVVLKTYVQLV